MSEANICKIVGDLHAIEAFSSGRFYYINRTEVFRCALCGVGLGYRQEGDDPF